MQVVIVVTVKIVGMMVVDGSGHWPVGVMDRWWSAVAVVLRWLCSDN